MPTEDTWSPVAGLKQASYRARQRTWVRTPFYGALLKDQKPVNPYTDSRINMSQTKLVNRWAFANIGTWTYQQNGYPFTGTSGLDAMNQTFTAQGWDSTVSGMINQTVVKAYNKIADAKVNLAVAYAEAKKTSDMILGTAKRIHDAYRAFRKGDLRGVAQNLNITPKRLHKSWLEYKYGWMPLLMDVKGAAEFFAQQHVIRPPRFHVSAVEQVVKTYTVGGDGMGYGSVPHDPWTALLTGSYKVHVKVWCELSYPHLSEMQQLGLTNPALVAWELVPFSFVFDWFIHVGDWLTALTALNGVTVRRAMWSVENSRAMSYESAATSVQQGNIIYVDEGNALQVSQRSYTRSGAIPSVWTLYPPVANSFNFPKLVTSLALIQGNFRGRDRTLRS